MLTRAEKDELLARCLLMLRDQGEFKGRNGATETRFLYYEFDDFQIKATVPENPESTSPIHLELRLMHPFRPGHLSKVASQIFIADVFNHEGEIRDHLWTALEEAPKALAALRKLMVLDDLSQV